MFNGLLGVFVWVAANFAYYSYVRNGERGFKRLAAFWLGFPITLVSTFVAPQAERVRAPRRNLSTTMGHSTGLIREQCPVW